MFEISSLQIARTALELELFPKRKTDAITETKSALENLIQEIKEMPNQAYRLTEIGLILFAKNIEYIKSVREKYSPIKAEEDTQLDLTEIIEEKRLTQKYSGENLKKAVLEELEPINEGLKTYESLSLRERKELSERILRLESICSNYERRLLVA